MFISFTCWMLYFYQCMRLRMSIARYVRSLRNFGNSPNFAKLSSVVIHQNSATSQLLPFDVHRSSGLCSLFDKQVTCVHPMIKVQLKDWTSYISKQGFNPVHPGENNKCYVVLEAEPLSESASVETNAVQLSQYVTPIAWKAGIPFGIIAECSFMHLKELFSIFSGGSLVLEDGLQVNCISTVDLEGHAINLLRLNSAQGSLRFEERSSAWPALGADASSPSESPFKGSNESLAYPSSDDILDDDSPERDNMQDEFDDFNQFDSDAGEALSLSIEEIAPEVLSPMKGNGRGNHGKPPNVLIYCGKKDSARQFGAISSVVKHCLNVDKYVVYHLKHEAVFTAPWQDNTLLLIVASDKVYDGVDECFLRFFEGGGSLISFGSLLDKYFVNRSQISNNLGILTFSYSDWSNVHAISGRHVYDDAMSLLPGVELHSLAVDRLSKKPVLLQALHEGTQGNALLSQIHLDKDPAEMAINPEMFSTLKQANPVRFSVLKDWFQRFGIDCSSRENLPLSPLFIHSLNEGRTMQMLQCIQPRINKDQLLRSDDVFLKFMNAAGLAALNGQEIKADCIPVVTDQTEPVSDFDFNEYSKHLRTKVLGQVVFYADVVTSTMSLFDGWMFCLPSHIGVAAVAKHQVKGVGRGGNAWLSPAGCAMFSVHISIPVQSTLGQRVAYVQHISSLAIVLAVRSISGYEDLDMRIKWPNDIYFGSNMKLGGVLVKSSLMQKDFHCNIGCGVNVSNKDPTICINDLVEQHNIQRNTSLAPFTTERIIAAAITHMEMLVDLFRMQGKDAFLELYYDKWLHSDVPVQIQKNDGSNLDVKIIGLDDFGYLLVQSEDGATQSVHPDGNSFDMMRNLIVPKQR